jgi:hypothetical protein
MTWMGMLAQLLGYTSTGAPLPLKQSTTRLQATSRTSCCWT